MFWHTQLGDGGIPSDGLTANEKRIPTGKLYFTRIVEGR